MRRAGALLAPLLLAAALAGCSTPLVPVGSFCVPRLIASSTDVVAGETITVTSDTVCDIPPPAGGWTVLVAEVGAPGAGERTTVDEEFDGSFEVAVTVPAHLTPGEAFVAIENWDYSNCPDNASCASPSASLTVRAAPPEQDGP